MEWSNPDCGFHFSRRIRTTCRILNHDKDYSYAELHAMAISHFYMLSSNIEERPTKTAGKQQKERNVLPSEQGT